MPMKSIAKFARLAGISLIVALPLTVLSGTAEAYQCKSTVVHAEAHHTSLGTAQTATLAAWASQTKAQYGLPWSVWTIANARSFNCAWTGNRHWCIAEAKPCLYVVK